MIKRLFLIILTFLIAGSAAAQDIIFDADVDKDSITMNEQMLLTLTVRGSVQNMGRPQMPNIDGFSIYSSGNSQNISIIQGRVSSLFAYNYTLIPKRPGKFTIGSCYIDVGGRSYKTNPIAVEVVSGSVSGKVPPPKVSPTPPSVSPRSRRPSRITTEAGGDENLFIVAEVDKYRAYVNEQITLTFYFYRAVRLLENPEYAPPDTTGFWVEDLPPQKNYYDTVGGKRYLVAELKTALFPTSPGKYEIGPATLRCIVETRGRGSVFEMDPFDIFHRDISDLFGGGKAVMLKSRPIDIEVLPLPEEGKPKEFAGSVGDYQVSASLDKAEVEATQPVTLELRVKGKGNVKTVAKPELPAMANFKTYDSGSTTNTSKESYTVQGEKIFKYILIPKKEGKYDIPGLDLTYFDPDKRKYITKAANSLHLSVAPAPKDAKAGPMISFTPEKESVRFLGRDIHYIRPEIGSLETKHWLTRQVAASILGIPAFLFLIALAYNRHSSRLATDTSYARHTRAQRRAKNMLRRANALLGKAKSKEFTSALWKALSEYIADRLNVPPATINADYVRDELTKRDVASSIVDMANDCCQELEVAQFAPMEPNEASLRSLLDKTEEVIVELERSKFYKKKKNGQGKKIIGLIVVLLIAQGVFLSLASFAEPDVAEGSPYEVLFGEANEAYKAQDYQRAISTYGEILDRGIISVNIYYNLGNTYYKLGELAPAILNYERGLKINPGDAQLIDNLALARSRTVDKITVAGKNYLVWLTERLLGLLPYRSFAVFTLVVYLLFMIIAISGLLSRPARPQVFKAAVILGCIFIAGLLLFMTDRYLEKNRIPAIAMKEEIPVRYGPSEADTIAFNVHSGTKVFITGSEGSWYQIRLESNEGGWVNMEALEKI
ncbi:MAG: BatD family protein [Candidatus Omnitrophica bacterium]|nr:BatD family protein [Candidatus Omnitrophota bacterium]